MAANYEREVVSDSNCQNLGYKHVLEAKGFRDVEEIGRGAYAKVFRVLNSEDGESYAIKCVPERDCGEEACILQMVDHENIIKIYRVWSECHYKLDVNTEGEVDSSVQVTGESMSGQSDYIDDDDDEEVSMSELGITPVPPEADRPSDNGDCHISENNYVNSEANSSRFCIETGEIGQLQNTQTAFHQKNTEERHVYMMLELCDCNLADILFGEENFDPVMEKAMFKSIVKGLDHLHSKRVIHNDLKLDNIFIKKPPKIGAVGDTRITQEIIPKIGDLGNAKIWEDEDLFQMLMHTEVKALGNLAVCIFLRPKNDGDTINIIKAIEGGCYENESVEQWILILIRKILTCSLSAKDVLDYFSQQDDKTSSNSDQLLESCYGIRLVSTPDDDT